MASAQLRRFNAVLAAGLRPLQKLLPLAVTLDGEKIVKPPPTFLLALIVGLTLSSFAGQVKGDLPASIGLLIAAIAAGIWASLQGDDLGKS